MATTRPQNTDPCPASDLSAYIDGELTPAAELVLEEHLAECVVCRDELNLQKSILLALDSSLEDDSLPLPPENFTRTIVTNAESTVSGLRRPSEWASAVVICLALFLFAFIVLGPETGTTLAAFGTVAERSMSVIGAIVLRTYDLALGLTIIARSLISGPVSRSSAVMVGFPIVFFASLVAFSRLYSRRDPGVRSE